MRAALLLAAGLLTACGSEAQADKPDGFAIRGSIGVPGIGDVPRGDVCVARDGYDDIRAGAQVLITSGERSVLAKGHLDEGRMGDECRFTFEVKVPGGHDFYTIEVGRRGDLTYSRQEAAGFIDLSLG